MMDVISLVLLGFGLAMDAFAVSICKGLSTRRIKLKDYVIVGVYFGGFQGLMPCIGYVVGQAIESYIESIDHWIAFALLLFIGLKMIKDSFCAKCAIETNPFSPRVMLPLAIATSIDALAVGISFALLETNIVFAALIIAFITASLCALGLKISKINQLAKYVGNKAHLLGGIVLIFIGTKILIQHLIS